METLEEQLSIVPPDCNVARPWRKAPIVLRQPTPSLSDNVMLLLHSAVVSCSAALFAFFATNATAPRKLCGLCSQGRTAPPWTWSALSNVNVAENPLSLKMLLSKGMVVENRRNRRGSSYK